MAEEAPIIPTGNQQGSVEAAAVRPDTTPAPLTDEDRVRIDAALRDRTPRPPLTDEEVARLEAQRGQPITPEERKYMDGARENGIST